MRKISRASDSIWHVGATPEEEYAELKARQDSHRSDAKGLSDEELHNAHDDMADDIELDKHNQYPFFDHFFNAKNFGPDGDMPERTPAQKAHDDLRSRRSAFGDELDARGLWGPQAEADRDKMVSRVNDWPKNYGYRENLIARGILQPEDSYSGDKGFDKYMGEGGFDLPRAKAIGARVQEEGERLARRKMTKLFGGGGFNPSDPSHQAIRRQVLDEHERKQGMPDGGN